METLTNSVQRLAIKRKAAAEAVTERATEN